ncbi:DNA kinase/phosphatase Pnk1 [Xylariaceae sp. FL0255]|nr:DNA kinase/phosphatase Pnk1 [Xylariaceae sp. FL0255]
MDPPSPGSSKRKATEKPISPPPVKRKTQSTTTKSAVASFFTPTSQKPKDRTVWSERAPSHDEPGTLLVGRYEPENVSDADRRKRRKIAAFDFDSTLIVTASGKKFGNEPTDWKWWHPSVPTRLRQLYNDEDYRIVILSNQGGLTLHADPNSKGPKNAGKAKVNNFKHKCAAVLSQLDIPMTSVYAATARDGFRKPRTGMWDRLCEDYELNNPEDVDLENSIFVGDAGGRVAQVGSGGGSKDFSCSDRNFAHNVGIKYQTPEEFFLGEAPRDFEREFDLASYPFAESGNVDGNFAAKKPIFEKVNPNDIVLFCGPPGAGKSTFFWTYLKPLGYERVNQDILKSRARCFKAAGEFLEGGNSVVIDNTNADADGRREWIEFGKKHGVPVRCVWFKMTKALCEHNDAVRALNQVMNPESRTILPAMAFSGFFSRYREPTLKEGFQDLTPIEFKFRGTKEEYAIWGRYWN